MQIEIIDVSAPQTPAGKKYKFIEIAYKKDGAMEGKKLMDFANPAVFKQAQEFKKGDIIEVRTVKNEKGYWDWAGFTAPGEAGAQAPAERAVGTAPKTVSNYETKEERAARQVLIVRQSSLSNALTALNGKKFETKDVLALAEEFAGWVFNAPTAAKGLDDFPDDIL